MADLTLLSNRSQFSGKYIKQSENGKIQITDREAYVRESANKVATNFLKNSLANSYGTQRTSNLTTLQGQNAWFANSGRQYTFNVLYGTQNQYRFAKSQSNNGMPYQNPIQINALGESTKLKTAIGDGEIFLDMLDDNDSLGLGEVGKLGNLFNFDSNGDGFLNHEDELFSKLKIRVDKGDGGG
ncbi:hypothetical protein LS70_003440 [Helicobacter sp. MIT 11-5569]|uniref:hypothetical protein n=1 Tax=Helicobacter sp. MIT 11-5569 TaxID=1548151 RepID=UPI00051FA386|nr:hypothetical protein [Helicobacter sp. MIT 11-5569]TLD83874.1 hypothetical protein LS70_003440 [Helicobacter sp. MIT 11-5569]